MIKWWGHQPFSCHFLFWHDKRWVSRRTYHLMPLETRNKNGYGIEVWIETVFKIYVVSGMGRGQDKPLDLYVSPGYRF